MDHLQSARILVDQATVDVSVIFGGGSGWGNNSAPLSAPLPLGVSVSAALTTTQKPVTFAAGRNAPNAGTTAASLNWTLMGGTTTQCNARVVGNGLRGAASAASMLMPETTTAATSAGQ